MFLEILDCATTIFKYEVRDMVIEDKCKCGATEGLEPVHKIPLVTEVRRAMESTYLMELPLEIICRCITYHTQMNGFITMCPKCREEINKVRAEILLDTLEI